MASIRLRIEVNPNGETEFGKNDGVEKIGNIINDNAELSNVSYKTDDTNIFNITTVNENGREMLSWANNGVLQFNSDGLLSTDGVVAGALASETDPDMFVWGAVPENKQYYVKLTFSNATSLKDIVVYGDKTANQFPTKAIVDGTKTIYSDDYQWAINMETESDTHTIEFLEWNRANYNACLTRIMVMLRYFDLDKGWIDSVESLTQSTSDASSINYGILANSGSANISDLNGEIEDYVRDGIMPSSNLDVKLLVNGNQIQEHIISDSNYDITQKEFSAQMTNKLSDLGSIKYKGFIYQGEPISLYNLLTDVMSNLTTQSIDDMMSSDIKAILQRISIEYPSIGYEKTYEEVLNEICTLAQLNMICDEDNNYKFYSARPLYSYNDKIIQIPDNCLVETPKYDVFLKNKFDGVEISELKVSDEIDYDTVVYPANVKLDKYEESDFTKSTKNNQEIKERSQFVSSATFYYEIASYISSDYYYYTGSISIPKRSEDNLSQITKINESLFRTNNFSYSLKYNKYKATATADSVWDRGDNEISVSNISYGDDVFEAQISEDGVITDTSSYTATMPDSTTTTSSTSTSPDNSSITMTEDDKNYYVTYKICVQKKITKLGGVNGWTAASTSSINISLSGELEKYVPLELDFSIYGNKRTISFYSVPASSENIENCKTKASVSNTGNLLQTGTKYGDVKLSEHIKQNILSDYSNGVSTGSVKLFLTNLYYQDGTLAKNWENGEILNAGDLISFNEIDKVWRITGRKFTYDGEPLLNVEYQENVIIEDIVESGYFSFYGDTIVGLSKEGLTAYNNNLLRELIIPSSYTSNGKTILVTTIKANAFRGLSKITLIKLADTITTIGDYVFYDTSIENVWMPKSVVSIGEYAITSNNDIRIFYENSEDYKTQNISGYESLDNCIWFYYFGVTYSLNTAKGVTPYYCWDSLELLSSCEGYSITKLGSYFMKNGSSSGTANTSIKTITGTSIVALVGGTGAFQGATALTTVTMSSLSFTSLPNYFFDSCSSLTTFTFSASYTMLVNGSTITPPNRLPENITSIGTYAFNGCTSLTQLTIPKACTTISNYAFNNTAGLTIYYNQTETYKNAKMTISSTGNSGLTNSTWTYNDSFAGNYLDCVYDSSIGGYIWRGLLEYNGEKYSENSLEIPEYYDDGTNGSKRILQVGYGTTGYVLYTGNTSSDYYYSGITSIVLPSSITKINANAFRGATALVDIEIGDTAITTIGNYAFYGCTGLTSITFPSTLTSIGGYAFNGCTSLVTVTIPSSVTSLGEYAFGGCSRLTSAVFNTTSLTTIESYAFYGTALVSVIIPEGVTTIGAGAFNISTLVNVSLPTTISTISNSAFNRTNAANYYYKGSMDAWFNVTIKDSMWAADSTLYVGSASGHTFDTATNPFTKTTCYKVTGLVTPSSVLSIGAYQFYGLSQLTSVTFHTNITTIGDYAFYNCNSLSTVLYTGSESDANNITIESGNDDLINATWIYNYGS